MPPSTRWSTTTGGAPGRVTGRRPRRASAPEPIRAALRVIVRHPVAAIFVIALAVRVGGIVLVHLLPERAMSIDDITYSWLAEQMAAGRTARWDAPTRALY